MHQYVIRRVLLAVPTIFLVVTLTFLATHIQPDYAERSLAAGYSQGGDREKALEQVRKSLGTDRPLHVQYGDYLLDVLKGDFGRSFLTKNSVMSELGERLAPSVELGILQISLGLLISVPIGIISAVKQDTWIDYLLRFVAVLGLAIPSFYLATIASLVAFRWLSFSPPLVTTAYREIWEDPVANLQMMALPAVAGAFSIGAVIMRLLRSQLLEVLRQDYVRTAAAKGLANRVIIFRHVLKNALIPVVTVLGLLVATLFSGQVVLEQMFSIPGVGLFLVTSLQQNDFPVVQGVVLLVGILLVTTNLVVDLAYAWLDPRIRYS